MSADILASAQKETDEQLRAHWMVIDGVLQTDGKGSNLYTQKNYGDFELYIDWKTTSDAASGIYLRGCPGIQIWDGDQQPHLQSKGEKDSDSLWNNKRFPRLLVVKAERPLGQWNTFHIRMLGERATVKLNGKIVVDNVVVENCREQSKPVYATGPIALESHGNTVWFRNIFLREIPPEEANAVLSSRNADQFETVLNGRDLSGWAGDKDSYEVKNCTILCKSGMGGCIFTVKEYSDFVVRMEIKLPPGGNNGLAIRYPGTGEPHLDGMCELQVIDSEHPKYATLDPRQYHGSAYGMVPAHRGFLRPAGQWNFQQVTVKDSTIRVELNGTTILDADLAQVTEFKDDASHPGKDRHSGFFGFAGHNDPVAFRNIAIRELKSDSKN